MNEKNITVKESFDDKFYYYKAEVLRIIDGDTIKVRIDLGFNLTFTDNVRLARINAPEIRGKERPEGLEAKAWLDSQISVGDEIYLKTFKWKGKYGRYIAEVILKTGNKEINISDEMVKNGHAKYVEY